jgi:hypothetical protein
MKTTIGVIIGIIVVILIIIGIRNSDTETSENTLNNAVKGTVYVSVTDATANIANVNEIDLSVKKVELHSAAQGWMTIAADDKSYGLLALKQAGRTELYAKADVAADTYDRVRVTLGDATVKTKTRGDLKAVLPSPYVVINTNLTVGENTSSNLKLDILADQSLHTTSTGTYVFAPVVVAEARGGATVAVANDNAVSVSGGTLSDTTTVGVDLTGVSKEDFRLTTDNSLRVQSSTTGGTASFILGGKTYTLSPEASGDASSGTSGSTNTNVNTNTGTGTGSSGSGDYDTGSVNINLNGALDIK